MQVMKIVYFNFKLKLRCKYKVFKNDFDDFSSQYFIRKLLKHEHI